MSIKVNIDLAIKLYSLINLYFFNNVDLSSYKYNEIIPF